MSLLKYDKVILTKPFDKMEMIGETYEIASVSEDSFIIRDERTKATIGVIDFEEFNEHFKKATNVRGWTPWVKFAGKDGEAAFYKTNYRKVEVKCSGVKAVASCNLGEDEFNLHFGVALAYGRCVHKALMKEKNRLEKELKAINGELKDNLVLMRRMVASLEKGDN